MRVQSVTVILNSGELDELRFDENVEAAEHPDADNEQALNEAISLGRAVFDSMLPGSSNGSRRGDVLAHPTAEPDDLS